MKNRIRFISHKDKKILLVDGSNCSAEQLQELAALVPTRVTAEPRGSVLLLADFTGSKIDKKSLERLKPALVLDRPHLKRSAWVGTENLPRVFYEPGPSTFLAALARLGLRSGRQFCMGPRPRPSDINSSTSA